VIAVRSETGEKELGKSTGGEERMGGVLIMEDGSRCPYFSSIYIAFLACSGLP
jgi:hypothetical protein